MESKFSKISARSKRQAMDWSLVLASQEIDTWIQFSPQEGGWLLIVRPQDYDRAVSAIQQYRRENRGWAWRRRLEDSGFVFHWGALWWSIALMAFYFFQTAAPFDLQQAGRMDGPAVQAGQWWRLFTAIFLHADVGHLAANATIGLLTIGLAMARYGAGLGLLTALLAGAGGNSLGIFFYSPPYRAVGASGMVMGAVGLLTAQSFGLWRRFPAGRKYFLSALLGGLMLFVLLGLDPSADVLAHAGGFGFGLLLGGAQSLFRNLAENSLANRIAIGLLFGLAILSWALALF